jgi:hypothetical protein
MIALSWWWGELSPQKFEGALDFGSVDLDFGFDVGHVPPKVSLALNFCATALRNSQDFLLQIGPISQRDIISGTCLYHASSNCPVLMKRQCLHQGCLALLFLNLDPKLNHRSHPLQHISLSILKVRSGFLLFSSKRFMAPLSDDKHLQILLFLVPLMSEAPTLLRWIKRTSDLSLVHERLPHETTPHFCTDEWVMLGNAEKVGRAFRARGVCDTAVGIGQRSCNLSGSLFLNSFSSISQSSVLLSVLI